MSVAAVDVAAVGDEIVGVVLAVDAAVIVDVAVVDVAVTAAAVYAVDAVPAVVDVNAAVAELQTFPGDAASVAGQQVNRFDCL